jgi:Arc/MetJ-type ribon-helix-helix transcriptional regulator
MLHGQKEMPVMNLALPPEIQRLIEGRVESGRYPCPEDVVSAAITHLDQQERVTELEAAELEVVFPNIRDTILKGIAEAEAGQVQDGEAFFLNE